MNVLDKPIVIIESYNDLSVDQLECPEDLNQEFIDQLTRKVLKPLIGMKADEYMYQIILQKIDIFFKEFNRQIIEWNVAVPELYIIIDRYNPTNINITDDLKGFNLQWDPSYYARYEVFGLNGRVKYCF